MLDRLNDDHERLELTDSRLKLQNDLRATALQAIAGLAVLVGAVVAFQQLTEDRQQASADRELTRQGQASERFTRAIDQIGSSRREVQLGGIYGLEQIARQAPDNRLAVTEVLVAYLHRRATKIAKPTAAPSGELRLRAPDVQAVLTVIARRQTAPTDPVLDLRSLDLSDADLRGADLRDVDLRDVDLSGADLRAATFHGAHLHGANLDGANLGYAFNFPGGPGFLGVDLGFADLSGADLSGADLHGAYLGYAKLSDANLQDANLGDANLRDASADQRTRWPSGFDLGDAGIRLR